jgi:hypothetical protein
MHPSVLSVVLLLLAPPASSSYHISPISRSARDHVTVAAARRCSPPRAGLFDGLFGESEADKQRKEEEWRAQQEMLARRRNPQKMAEYMREVDTKRAEAMAADAELRELQQRGGGDKLDEWKQLRAEGKVKASGQERDAGSARLGSEGLIAERIDEQLPYIDDGYVDQSQPDLMEGINDSLRKLGDIFGGDAKR